MMQITNSNVFLWHQFTSPVKTLLKKIRPLPDPERQQLKDLERLALVSPHLLADLGFEKDPRTSRPGITMWRNGSLRVEISSNVERSVSFLAED